MTTFRSDPSAANVIRIVAAQAEIEEAIWVDLATIEGLTLAPLTQTCVMPLARALKGF